ncbi:MAG: DUF6456 domain-containing protein [Pseudomonadota bacterium]
MSAAILGFDIEKVRRDILPKLLFPGVTLIAARGLETAVILIGAGEETRLIDRLPARQAEWMRLQGWVDVAACGSALRYTITDAGRQEAGRADPPERTRKDPLLCLPRNLSAGVDLCDTLLARAADLRAEGVAIGLTDEVAPSLMAALQGGPVPDWLDPDARLLATLQGLDPMLGAALVYVICLWWPWSRFERAAGLPARSGKLVLALALRQIAAAPDPMPALSHLFPSTPEIPPHVEINQ